MNDLKAFTLVTEVAPVDEAAMAVFNASLEQRQIPSMETDEIVKLRQASLTIPHWGKIYEDWEEEGDGKTFCTVCVDLIHGPGCDMYWVGPDGKITDETPESRLCALCFELDCSQHSVHKERFCAYEIEHHAIGEEALGFSRTSFDPPVNGYYRLDGEWTKTTDPEYGVEWEWFCTAELLPRMEVDALIATGMIKLG